MLMIGRCQANIWNFLRPSVFFVFGHQGFNNLSAALLSHPLRERIRLTSDGVPQPLWDGWWLISHTDTQLGAVSPGLDDQTLDGALRNAYAFCLSKNCLHLITNGVQVSGPHGHEPEAKDARARQMFLIAQQQEQQNSIATTFVDLSDVFLRNSAPF